MAYSDFKTLTGVTAAFDLTIDESHHLFPVIDPIQPSPYLTTTLQENLPLVQAINTEKARSELVIAPVLLELRRYLNYQISFFSGSEFSVDPEVGLSGYCDYILSASKEIYEIRSPLVMIVEAKNENIKAGLGQCLAEMVAAQRFNQMQQNPIQTIYGSVTTGSIWKFLTLVDQLASIDLSDYYIKEIDQVLGILVASFTPILP